MNTRSHSGKRPRFSIVTPCFRGAIHLPGLHASMKELSCEGGLFEWIIVDDFSDDDGETAKVIKALESETAFVVHAVFLAQNHHGAKSVEAAASHCSGEYTIILDQDDRLTKDALEIFTRYIEKYSIRPDFAGVCGRCVNSENRLIGRPLKEDELYTTEMAVRHHTRIRGEMFQCTKTELIERYFADMETGYTNGYAWTRLALDGFKFVYVNQVVRLYDTGNPHSMSNQRRIRLARNEYRQAMFYLDGAMKYLLSDPVEIIRFCVHCERYKIHALNAGARPIAPNSFSLKALLILVHPLATLLAISDRAKRRVIEA